MFLGANWYALIASIGLAVLFIIHIIYALWLTLQNRKARGTDRYAVTSRPPQVEWSSKNMLVLGIVVLAFLVVHLIQFWAKMQLQELLHTTATVNGVPAAPEFGTLFLQAAFSEVWTPIVYIIGFLALGLHMSHGFWSMFHSVGWDGSIWINRLKCIGNIWTVIVIALFVAQAIVFTVKAHNNSFINDEALQEQYAEYWGGRVEATITDINNVQMMLQSAEMTEAQKKAVFAEALATAAADMQVICDAVSVQCPDATTPVLRQAPMILAQMTQQLSMYTIDRGAPEEAIEVDEEVVETE